MTPVTGVIGAVDSASSGRETGWNRRRVMVDSAAGTYFVGRHGCWNEEQAEAADRLVDTIEQHRVEVVRVSIPDLFGIPRGKAFVSEVFVAGMRNGFELNPATLLLGSADERVFDSFSAAPLGMPQLSGSTNLIVVPDPLTFRVLPWAPGTGWVVADAFFQDGTPCPLDTRRQMRRALEQLEGSGFEYVSGLEVECYVFRIEDPSLRVDQLGGGPGFPADPPEVSAVAHGFRYLQEHNLDQIDDLLRTLRRQLREVGVPLRSIDDEWGPGQIEFVCDPVAGLAGADAMFLLRSAAKQICRRAGHLITFMCEPRIPTCYASGWHLHQSLQHLDSHQNAFAPQDGSDEPLSQVGRHYMGGLMEHAIASSVLTTPSVTGYRRRRPFSLAPERVTWAPNHRGAMVRVVGGADPANTHIENRMGEPAANPYLYMASQIMAGLDGLRHGTDPGPRSIEPDSDLTRPLLPKTLMEAVEVLRADPFHRAAFGDVFIDYVAAVEGSMIDRYLKARGSPPSTNAADEPVTEWEHREYFERM